MKILKFILQYILNPRDVGAIIPSSQKLSYKMVENINFNKAKCIVEYGPGTGVFTDKLIEKRNKNTVILIFENNNEFYNLLKHKFKEEKNLFIINDSAENVEEHLKIHDIADVDYVISGLPFASLPKKVSCSILNKTNKILRKEGKFITFQYTLLKKDFINEYFKKVDVKREFINIPPAYILSCGN